LPCIATPVLISDFSLFIVKVNIKIMSVSTRASHSYYDSKWERWCFSVVVLMVLVQSVIRKPPISLSHMEESMARHVNENGVY
jgi:hypothetical protein